MAVAPLAVLLYDRVFVFDSWRDAVRERGWFYGALAATWVELGLLMWRWPRSTVGAARVSPWTYLLNQADMIARYLGLAVWPQSLVIDYGLPRAIGVADVAAAGAAGAGAARRNSGRARAVAGDRVPRRPCSS